MKLRGFPQRFRHQIIGEFKSLQNGEWAFHNGLRELAMDPVGDGRNQLGAHAAGAKGGSEPSELA